MATTSPMQWPPTSLSHVSVQMRVETRTEGGRAEDLSGTGALSRWTEIKESIGDGKEIERLSGIGREGAEGTT